MPTSSDGFGPSYNEQAAVDKSMMLAVVAHVTQASNGKRQIVPTLDKVAALSKALGQIETLS